jgi:sulfoxide reductase heme-binding subunit YedZ
MTVSQIARRGLKPAAFILSLVPLVLLASAAITDGLSANPIDDITDTTGTWTLRFLLLTLAVTPIRTFTGWNGIAPLRKMLGLFAFFYGCLHLTTYVWLDKFFDWPEMVADVRKRPFITMGMTAFVLLTPLAITSANRMIRLLGGKRWKQLHRLVYAVAVAGVVHYLWLVKADRHRPLIYGGILLALLGIRVLGAVRNRIASAQAPAPS